MEESPNAALSRLLSDHVRMGPSRRETTAELIAVITKAGTVNLIRLAQILCGMNQGSRVL
jgi:hypothetical protein